MATLVDVVEKTLAAKGLYTLEEIREHYKQFSKVVRFGWEVYPQLPARVVINAVAKERPSYIPTPIMGAFVRAAVAGIKHPVSLPDWELIEPVIADILSEDTAPEPEVKPQGYVVPEAVTPEYYHAGIPAGYKAPRWNV